MAVVLGLALPATPVIVPEVGRGRERAAVATIAAARRLGRLVAACRPELIVLLLPPDAADGPAPTLFTAAGGALRRGFDSLDAPELVRDDPIDAGFAAALAEAAGLGDAGLVARASEPAPETALASLYFLSPAAALPVALLSGGHGGDAAAERLGAAIAAAAAARPVAVCAVGELSSRLFRGAPGGYSPSAEAFDRRALAALQAGGPAAARDLPEAERTEAGESILRQLVALGAALGPAEASLLSYEAPFGAGFLAAAWRPHAPHS